MSRCPSSCQRASRARAWVAGGVLAGLMMSVGSPLASAESSTTPPPVAAEVTPEPTQPSAPAELEPVEIEAVTIEREANNARDRVAYAAYVLAGLGVVMMIFTALMWRATKPLPTALRGLAALRANRRGR